MSPKEEKETASTTSMDEIPNPLSAVSLDSERDLAHEENESGPEFQKL